MSYSWWSLPSSSLCLCNPHSSYAVTNFIAFHVCYKSSFLLEAVHTGKHMNISFCLTIGIKSLLLLAQMSHHRRRHNCLYATCGHVLPPFWWACTVALAVVTFYAACCLPFLVYTFMLYVYPLKSHYLKIFMPTLFKEYNIWREQWVCPLPDVQKACEVLCMHHLAFQICLGVSTNCEV